MNDRRALIVKLKCGEYDGADIMEAWLRLEQDGKRIEALEGAATDQCIEGGSTEYHLRKCIADLEEQCNFHIAQAKKGDDLLLKRIAELKALLERAHNWVLDNEAHSESYNQFVKALHEQDDE